MKHVSPPIVIKLSCLKSNHLYVGDWTIFEPNKMSLFV